MNWILPKAPAHEPFRCSAGTSPCSKSRAWREILRGNSPAAGRCAASVAVVPPPGALRLASEFQFDPPDGGQDVAVDAIGYFNGVERRAVLRDRNTAGGDAIIVHEVVEIVPDRFLEFGLAVQKLHDLEIGREPARRRVEGAPGDAALRGVRPQRLEATVEIGRRGSDRLGVISGCVERWAAGADCGALPVMKAW